MRYLTAVLCVLMPLGLTVEAAAQVAYERDGNIYVRTPGGTERRLTFQSRDRSPSLSADTSEVVFRRELTPSTVGDDGSYELRIVDLKTGKDTLLLDDTFDGVNGWSPSFFAAPQFSPDSRLIYFMTREAQTSYRVMRLNRDTGRVDSLIPGAVEFHVIPVGRYAGDIVARLRRYVEATSSYGYFFYLLDSTGHEIEFIGSDDEKTYFFESFVEGQ